MEKLKIIIELLVRYSNILMIICTLICTIVCIVLGVVLVIKERSNNLNIPEGKAIAEESRMKVDLLEGEHHQEEEEDEFDENIPF